MAVEFSTKDLSVIFAVAGIAAVLLAILGGGIKIKDIVEIPKISERSRVVLFVVGAVLVGLAFIAPGGKPSSPAGSNSTPTPTSGTAQNTPVPPEPTAAPASPAPGPIAMAPMDRITAWEIIRDENGSALAITTVDGYPGTNAQALQLAFNIKRNGYVGVSPTMPAGLLTGTSGMQFAFRGSGRPNTIQVKLFYASGTVFSIAWPAVTSTQDWNSLIALWSDFLCWTETPDCPPDRSLELDPSRVAQFSIIINNSPDDGDQQGEGVLVLDEVVALP